MAVIIVGHENFPKLSVVDVLFVAPDFCYCACQYYSRNDAIQPRRDGVRHIEQSGNRRCHAEHVVGKDNKVDEHEDGGNRQRGGERGDFIEHRMRPLLRHGEA